MVNKKFPKEELKRKGKIGGRAGMVPPLEESEDGDRANFSRWEK